jgi:hypothetical protein
MVIVAGGMLVRVLFAGVMEVIKGAIESAVISTHVELLRLPALSWSQISTALAPWERLTVTDQLPEPMGTLHVPLIQTLVLSSRLPVREMDEDVDVFAPGRTCMGPLVTVPPMLAGGEGWPESTVKVKL